MRFFMTVTTNIGKGSTLHYSTDNGSTYVEIGEVKDGWDSSITVSKVDTTLLSDNYMSSCPSDIDPGTLTFECAAGNSAESAICGLCDSRTIAKWKLIFSSGKVEFFNGWVSQVEEAVKKRELLTIKFTVQKTGNPLVTGD